MEHAKGLGVAGSVTDNVENQAGTQKIILKSGAIARVLVTGNEAYISGNATVLNQYFGFPTAIAQTVGNRWISIPPSSTDFAEVSYDATLATVLKDFSLTGHLTELAPSTMDGQSVIGILGTASVPGQPAGTVGGTVYVSDSSKPLLVGAAYTFSKGTETSTLTHWDEHLALRPPSHVVALSVLEPASTAKESTAALQTAERSAAGRAIESIVTALFTALKAKNYAAACNDYTPDVQRLTVVAAKQISGETFTTCARALAATTNAAPNANERLRQLGAPHFTDLSINGKTATITYSSVVGNLVAHSTIVAEQQSNRWLIDRATSLTFTKR
jgi:ketosteroid isomerase-like protein